MIGQIDSGLPLSHEDLNIFNLSSEDKSRLSQKDINGNVLEICDTDRAHGTNMAGLAAAIVGNEVGIKGVCNAGALLDVHLYASRDNSGDAWPARAEYARQNFVDDNLVVFNTPFGWGLDDPDGYMTPAAVKMIWRAYVDGVLFARVGGNEVSKQVRRQETPYNLRIAGSTARDVFWGADPVNCDVNNQNCNRVIPIRSGSMLGQVTVCAPACGALTSTAYQEWPDRCGWGPYNTTCVKTSGAASMVGGLVATVHRYFRESELGLPAPPDFIRAALQTSAREFAEERSVMLAAYSQAAECTQQQPCDPFDIDDFGPGIVDVSRLKAVCDLYLQEYGQNGLKTHVVRYGDPGTVFEPYGTILTDPADQNKRYQVHALRAMIQVPNLGLPELPPAMVWAHPIRSSLPGSFPLTTTGLLYGSLTNNFVAGSEPIREHMLELFEELTNCDWRWLDQSVGLGELVGYNIEVLDDHNDHVGWVRDPDGMVMSASSLSAMEATSAEAGVSGDSDVELRLTGRQPSSAVALSWRTPRGEAWTIRIVDAGGREVERREGTGSATGAWMAWQPALASGAFWAVLRAGGRQDIRKLVVVR
ncbi:MAG: S8 family serine peptidase [Candidatus Eisenbacteria bacterium]|nr:S8 family serine peptidase [Candidatus Eisenbacteria bacterium]